MNKRQKALIVLLTPFVLGFLLGLLVGGGCSKKERPPKKEKTATVADSLAREMWTGPVCPRPGRSSTTPS